MSRATVILKTGDDPSTVGTCSGGYLGASALCQRCGKPDLSWVPDSLYGGGWDACGSCGHRVRVPLRRTPPVETPPAPGSLAHLNEPNAISWLHVESGRIGNVASTASKRRKIDQEARECAEAIPYEWTRADVLGKELGLLPTAWSNRITRMMAMGLVQRDVRPVPYGRGMRKMALVRRVA
ncbi:MAG: hypothetical protein ACK6AH_03070 [Gemmatimonadota bacterium]